MGSWADRLRVKEVIQDTTEFHTPVKNNRMETMYSDVYRST